MRRKRKGLSVFSLSFLDIMSCGLGAFILLFIIAKYSDQSTRIPNEDYLAIEIAKLDLQVADIRSQEKKVREEKTLSERQASEIKADITALNQAFQKAVTEARINKSMLADEKEIKESITNLKKQNVSLRKEVEENSAGSRLHVGDGNREYLTGMRLGGEHILVLLDSSTSMLDQSIVNIIRRRNMSDEVKKRSPKWRQALATIDWISARFPRTSQYQIYNFSDSVKPVIENTRGKWLSVNNTKQLNKTIESLRTLVPEGGSSLESALITIQELNPLPDNIYLITDGLPTKGIKPSLRSSISGRERQQLFEVAVTAIPSGIPINVILLPTEGDPMAPAAYWQIARVTQGSFLSPAEDWP